MAKETTTPEASGFVNPFATGVTYPKFIKALEGKSVSDYLSGKYKSDGKPFTKEDIAWLDSELASHKYHLENKDANLKRANAEHLILQDHNLSDKEKENILNNL